MAKQRVSNEQIIEAYQQTGSVWKAGKLLGIVGQSVHERLQAMNYPISGRHWSEEEYAELRELAGHMTIGQIATRLGRTYSSVAIKLSRLEINTGFGNKQPKKVPRTEKYLKAKIKQYVEELTESGDKPTTYARKNSLDIESLANAIQRFYPEWWEQYAEANAAKPKMACPHCQKEFWPLNSKQMYCSRKCGYDYRMDQSYFGGKRKNTIGLAERTCQLCGRKDVKGLSSHHMIGKENDPENEMLVALCPGCHQLVTWLGGRVFTGEPEVWQSLIQLVLIRKHGYKPDFYGVYCNVEIEFLTKEQIEEELIEIGEVIHE
jgi:hypothetical protein